MALLRRLLAMLLLTVLGLPLPLPALAAGQGDELALPACCRRDGKHHCAMSMGERAQVAAAAAPLWRTPLEHCPYNVAAPATRHGDPLTAPPAVMLAIRQRQLPAILGAALCRRRLARERARHKRGPPPALQRT